MVPGWVGRRARRLPRCTGLEPGDEDAQAGRDQVDDDLGAHAAMTEVLRVGRAREEEVSGGQQPERQRGEDEQVRDRSELNIANVFEKLRVERVRALHDRKDDEHERAANADIGDF